MKNNPTGGTLSQSEKCYANGVSATDEDAPMASDPSKCFAEAFTNKTLIYIREKIYSRKNALPIVGYVEVGVAPGEIWELLAISHDICLDTGFLEHLFCQPVGVV